MREFITVKTQGLKTNTIGEDSVWDEETACGRRQSSSRYIRFLTSAAEHGNTLVEMWKGAVRHAHGGDRGKDQGGACSERSTIRSTSCTSSLPPRRALNCTSEDIVWGKARDEVRVYITFNFSRCVNFRGLPAIHESAAGVH